MAEGLGEDVVNLLKNEGEKALSQAAQNILNSGKLDHILNPNKQQPQQQTHTNTGPIR